MTLVSAIVPLSVSSRLVGRRRRRQQVLPLLWRQPHAGYWIRFRCISALQSAMGRVFDSDTGDRVLPWIGSSKQC